jgi:hypothetical protein
MGEKAVDVNVVGEGETCPEVEFPRDEDEGMNEPMDALLFVFAVGVVVVAVVAVGG